MTPKLLIIGTMAVGAVIGGSIGAWMGDKEDGDFPMLFALYGLMGAGLGTFAGGTVGAVLFG